MRCPGRRAARRRAGHVQEKGAFSTWTLGGESDAFDCGQAGGLHNAYNGRMAGLGVGVYDQHDVFLSVGGRSQCIGNILDGIAGKQLAVQSINRSEEHTSELQSLMRISYAVFCLKKKKIKTT